jgi:Arc/MetJ-type ribon-helix-helix transcriptional regulator
MSRNYFCFSLDVPFRLSYIRNMVHETKLAIRLPSRIKRRLRREARGRFISDSDVAREAIIFFLDKRQGERQPKLQAA